MEKEITCVFPLRSDIFPLAVYLMYLLDYSEYHAEQCCVLLRPKCGSMIKHAVSPAVQCNTEFVATPVSAAL